MGCLRGGIDGATNPVGLGLCVGVGGGRGISSFDASNGGGADDGG